MSSGRGFLGLGLGLSLGLACQMPNPAFDEDTRIGGGESSTFGDTKPGESGGMDVGDGDGDPMTGDGDGDPVTGDGDGDPGTGDGDGDPGVGLCGLPLELLHQSCQICLDPVCCADLAACVLDSDCMCVATCVLLDGFGLQICLQDCMVNAQGNVTVLETFTCIQNNCALDCLP